MMESEENLEKKYFLRMEQNTKENGPLKATSAAEGESRFGRTEVCTKATGKTTKPMGMAD